MHQEKSFYSLAEAASRAKCARADLLHQAVQRKIVLFTGVPDWVNLQTFDQSTNSVARPFLMAPQLLALAQNHCWQIELHGKTEQSDFPSGYMIESSGQLRKLLPSYGRPELNHQWAFWRTYRQELVCLLELTPDRLFVCHNDLMQIINRNQSGDSFTDHASPDNKDRASSGYPETSVEMPKDAEVSSAGPKKRPKSESIGGGRNTQGNNALKKNGVDTSIDAVPARAEVNTNETSLKAVKPSDPITSSSDDAGNTEWWPGKKDTTILRLKQVLVKTGLSRSTIYDKLNSKSPRFDPTFPKQISLGKDSVGWVESEVETWLKLRIDSTRLEGK